MAETPVPDEVRQFLLKNIDSIAQWEALLLMRSDASKAWSPETLSHSLYIPEKDAASLLMQLAMRDIVRVEYTSPLSYHYAPESEEARWLVDRAAELYRTYLIPITHLIHSKSKNRIQAFADAFKLKKD